MSDRIREQVEDDRVGLGEAPAGHLSERQLVLSRLGDADDRQVVAEHLQECERCQERALGLDRQLEWIATISSEGIPEVDVGLQDRIWQRQRSNLLQRGIVARAANSNRPGPRPTPPLSRGGGRGRQLDWLRRRTLMPLAAAAAVVAVAFVLGWLLPSPIGRPADEGGPSVLLQTVAAHLDRSQVVLAELVNGVPDKSLNRFVDRAAELVADNRVYRQERATGAAPGSGEAARGARVGAPRGGAHASCRDGAVAAGVVAAAHRIGRPALQGARRARRGRSPNRRRCWCSSANGADVMTQLPFPLNGIDRITHA